MVKPLPARIELEDMPLTIVEGDFPGTIRARLDYAAQQITICRTAPAVEKHILLLHEFLHYTAHALYHEGVISAQPSEEFIINAAPELMLLLISAGVYDGITLAEFDEWCVNAPEPKRPYKNHLPPKRPR